MNAPPFDTIASTYDAVFTRSLLGRWLRASVWERLAAAFQAGDHVLELGCGTGEDAVYLARCGVRVHATDSAPAMLQAARRKAAAQGVHDALTFTRLDLASLGPDPSIRPDPGSSPGQAPHTCTRPYDGAFSNFGALNCLSDRRRLAGALARYIRPGGRLVLVVMGPLCPWEWGWYLLHGHVRTAFRRFQRGALACVGDGATLRVWYPSPRRLRREFAPYFRPIETAGIGVLLPPSFAASLVDRRPRLFRRLAALDRRAGRVFPGTWLNDHYLMTFERTAQEAPHA